MLAVASGIEMRRGVGVGGEGRERVGVRCRMLRVEVEVGFRVGLWGNFGVGLE